MDSAVELPDLFRFADGSAVTNSEDWRRRREELSRAILDIQYGGLPPTPGFTKMRVLHRAVARGLGKARTIQCRVFTQKPAWDGFRLDLLLPADTRPGPYPVVLTGDACWRYLTDDLMREILRRGLAIAHFSRVEVVPDTDDFSRSTGLYEIFPEKRYGAVAAWAWSYHRCVDVLQDVPEIDPKRIAVVGHSRGGKATLLAGATDERIALTSANGSGCGGAGCFRWRGPNSETLGKITTEFPHWFAPDFHTFADREDSLPFDQHSLKALVAPRPLFTTEALGDLWANPEGSWQTHRAALEAYRFLDAEQNLGTTFRDGEHRHLSEDWLAFLDFAELHFFNKPLKRNFNVNPFPKLALAHSWTAPARA